VISADVQCPERGDLVWVGGGAAKTLGSDGGFALWVSWVGDVGGDGWVPLAGSNPDASGKIVYAWELRVRLRGLVSTGSFCQSGPSGGYLPSIEMYSVMAAEAIEANALLLASA
jgi:hypothetical protein